MEAEAEAVDGRLKEGEAEAKEKLTAVASLLTSSPPPSRSTLINSRYFQDIYLLHLKTIWLINTLIISPFFAVQILCIMSF